MKKNKRQHKITRHKRVRATIKGTGQRPRLSVFRSSKRLWAQLIDDDNGLTIASAGSQGLAKKKDKNAKKMDYAHQLGKLIAQKALEKKINSAVFDRGGYKYHGLIRAVAEGAREGGLKF